MKQNSSKTIVSKICSQNDMDEFVNNLDIKSDVVLIKPNWVDGLDGSHTEAKALDMFLSSLNRKVIFIESYTYWRTDKKSQQGNIQDYFSSTEATIHTGKKHWDFFKEQDSWFFKHTGIDKILKQYQADYVNITNEIWEGNVVDANTIKKIVEARFSPIRFTEFYSYIPEKLFKYRDKTLISFAKAKKDQGYGLSLSIKNQFGLIPDPNRAAAGYHGDNDENLLPSIIDINKVYQSIFDARFIIDGVNTASLMDFDSNTTKLYSNWKSIIGGFDALNVDSVGKELLRGNFINAMKDLPILYQQVFGGKKEVEFKFNQDEYLVE